MATFRITVNAKQTTQAINRFKGSLEQRRGLLELIGTRLVAYTRETINMQGRGKSWKPLAASTKKSTGRDKALVTLIPFIKHRVNMRVGVTIYFSKRPRDWSIDVHESGFKSRAVPKGIKMKAKGLGMFSGRKASVIPARKIFPTLTETRAISRDITQDWVRDTSRKVWR